VTNAGRDQEDSVELSVHDGREFMYVLEGEIELTLEGKKHILKKTMRPIGMVVFPTRVSA